MSTTALHPPETAASRPGGTAFAAAATGAPGATGGAAGPASFEALTASLKAAGEPTRLRLLAVLHKGELTVTELTSVLCQSQPRISRHLKLLQDAGLVDRIREGAWVFYRARERHPLNAAIVDLLPESALIKRDRERLLAVQAARAATAATYFEANAGDWDRLRALHVSEPEVEAAMRALLGEHRIGRVVDLGTGTGRMLELFAGQADELVGIDASRDMLTLARARIDQAGLAHARVRQGDLFELDLVEEPALAGGGDLVVLHQVLHFLADPKSALRAAAELVRPGGRLIVVDFAPHEEEFLRTEHAHRRLGFSESEMRGYLEDAGLAVTAVRHLSPAPGAGRLTVSIWLAGRSHSPAQHEEAAQ